jgi:septal ring factor EnvC (AmiA/AmiB activator)
MAEIDNLVMQIERLETDNRRLKNQLKFANKEIDKCHKTIDCYEKMVNAEANLLDECAKNMRIYSDNIQEVYKQGK